MIDIQDMAGGFALVHKLGSRAVREIVVHQPQERLLDVECLDDPFNPKPVRGSDAPPRRSSRPKAGYADQG